ncbi:MAG: hypothetical protein AMXMBFR53_13880 [Gemmatimonadota bacterium]
MTTNLKRLGAAMLVLVAGAACDFEVTNPGPTDDAFLDNSEAHQAVANGAARTLSQALANVAYTTSGVTRELFPAGSTSSFGISARQQTGLLEYDDEHINDGPWVPAQQSRYIGESGFARFEEARGTSNAGYRPGVEAALWAGYANRLLGENWCEVAFDGGAIQPRADALKRAEEWFTKAIDAAGSTASLANQKLAAIAGRASVRVQLGDWAGAVADAGQVPTSFVWWAAYHDSEQSFFNRTYFAGAAEPYKAVTTWNTWAEVYYNATEDPRMPWVDTKGQGDAAVQMVGNKKVPFYRQLKFDQRGSDIRLSSGYEMRLIEAEAKLRGNDMAGAMAIVNARRTALGVAALAPADMTEAWTLFKRERGIELWLEGRRLGDLYRWKATNTPGALDAREQAGNPASYLSASQTLCYPISKAERENNPNIPDTP